MKATPPPEKRKNVLNPQGSFCLVMLCVACLVSASCQAKSTQPKAKNKLMDEQTKPVEESQTPPTETETKQNQPTDTDKETSEIATELKIPPENISKVKQLRVNRVPRGKVVLAKDNKERPFAAILFRIGETWSTRLFAEAERIELLGVADISKPGSLPSGLKSWGDIKTQGMAEPTLVVEVSFRDSSQPATLSPKRKKKTRGHRGDGIAKWKQLALFSVNGNYKSVLKVEHSRLSSDGFGGHRISGFKLVMQGNALKLTASRQDKLPARRARCKRPEPYDVEWVKENGRFKKLPTVKDKPCG